MPVLQTDAHHWTNLACSQWLVVSFYMLDSTIKIIGVIPANVKRLSNVFLMLDQRRIQWHNNQPTERQINVLTWGPLNVFSTWQTNISVFKITKAQWGPFIAKIGSLNSVWLPKNPEAILQSTCHNKNNPTKFKMATKKIKKFSPSIIVTWNVTIHL